MFSSFKVKLVLFAAFLLLMDFCVAPAFELSGARPLFLFLLVAYASFQWETRRVWLLAISVGLVRDILGGGILGVEMFAIAGGAFLLDWVVHRIEKEFPGIYFLLSVMFCFFVLIVEFLIDAALGKVSLGAEGSVRVIFLSSIYTGLFLPFFYQIADFLFKPHRALRQYELFSD